MKFGIENGQSGVVGKSSKQPNTFAYATDSFEQKDETNKIERSSGQIDLPLMIERISDPQNSEAAVIASVELKSNSQQIGVLVIDQCDYENSAVVTVAKNSRDQTDPINMFENVTEQISAEYIDEFGMPQVEATAIAKQALEDIFASIMALPYFEDGFNNVERRLDQEDSSNVVENLAEQLEALSIGEIGGQCMEAAVIKKHVLQRIVASKVDELGSKDGFNNVEHRDRPDQSDPSNDIENLAKQLEALSVGKMDVQEMEASAMAKDVPEDTSALFLAMPGIEDCFVDVEHISDPSKIIDKLADQLGVQSIGEIDNQQMEASEIAKDAPEEKVTPVMEGGEGGAKQMMVLANIQQNPGQPDPLGASGANAKSNGKKFGKQMKKRLPTGFYEVDKIIGHRVTNGQVWYETTWAGYDDVTFEPSRHFKSFDKIEEYFMQLWQDKHLHN